MYVYSLSMYIYILKHTQTSTVLLVEHEYNSCIYVMLNKSRFNYLFKYDNNVLRREGVQRYLQIFSSELYFSIKITKIVFFILINYIIFYYCLLFLEELLYYQETGNRCYLHDVYVQCIIFVVVYCVIIGL